MPVASKLGRMFTYLEQHPPIVTGPLNDVILLDHDTTIPMATKLGKVVIYSKLDDPSISWFYDVT